MITDSEQYFLNQVVDNFYAFSPSSQAKILSKIILNYNHSYNTPEYEQIAELAKNMRKILTKEERIRVYEWMSCLRVNLENISEEEE